MKRKTSSTAAKEPATPRALVPEDLQHNTTAAEHHEELTFPSLEQIREDAMRERSRVAETIAQLYMQREELDEQRNKIDATIAFLRALNS